MTHLPSIRADGKLAYTIIYLEMSAPPTGVPRPLPPDATIVRAHRPTVSFYRYLYDTVGAPYLWWWRRQLDEEALAAIIHDPLVEVHVLYAAGTPAGYVELDRRPEHEVEVAYFGLLSPFIGRGYGLSFLQWAVQKAWADAPRRVFVDTCTLDHPNAVNVYEKAGFEVYKREENEIDDPRLKYQF